jgi:regulator of replication initiation timing
MNNNLTTKSQAIAYFGSVRKMADRLNVSYQNVRQFKEPLTETLKERVLLRMLIDKYPEVEVWIKELHSPK